jgi:hypothetical protein
MSISEQLLSVLQHVSGSFKALSNSNFITAVVGSLAGAFGGAWAAQRIAERSKLREELVKEIRNTNAAASMLHGIANAHLGLKKQLVKPMYDAYSEEQSRHSQFLRAKNAGTVPPQQKFDVNLDLQTIKPLYSPTEAIQKLIFNEISLTGAAPFVAQVLFAAIQSLAELLSDRNRLVEDWKANPPPDLVTSYLGLSREGMVDHRYKTSIEGMYAQTDNIIAFSIMVGDALFEHAKAKRDTLRKQFHIEGPSLAKWGFSRFNDFLPPPEEFTNFANMFDAEKRPPVVKLRLHQRLWQKLKVTARQSR